MIWSNEYLVIYMVVEIIFIRVAFKTDDCDFMKFNHKRQRYVYGKGDYSSTTPKWNIIWDVKTRKTKNRDNHIMRC